MRNTVRQTIGSKEMFASSNIYNNRIATCFINKKGIVAAGLKFFTKKLVKRKISLFHTTECM
jgi:hypothetical protein